MIIVIGIIMQIASGTMIHNGNQRTKGDRSEGKKSERR